MEIQTTELSRLLPAQPYLDLLILSEYPRPPEEQVRRAREFRDSPNRFFWVVSVDGEPVGGCAVVESHEDLATIRSLGVREKLRGKDLGRRLVETAIGNAAKSVVGAEIDGDARELYRRCGFVVHDIGEKYPGVTRYTCRYAKPHAAAPREI